MSPKVIEIVLRGKPLKFDLSQDHYPVGYYQSIAEDIWEPNTVGFFEREFGPSKVLIDIGAATGVTALFAASLGATVHAFEPNPWVFGCLIRNIKLNGRTEKIHVKELAISNKSDTITFSATSDPAVISPITVTGGEKYAEHVVHVVSIVDTLQTLSLPDRKHVVMKMDIEGAEYRIMLDQASVQAIAQHCHKVLLSLHPGFTSSFSSLAVIRTFQRILRIPQLWRQHVRLFRLLSKVGSIEIYGVRRITTARHFAALVVLGMHDWIIQFR